MYTCMHACLYFCMYFFVYVCTCTYMHANTYTVYVCMHACLYLCMYMFVYVCSWTYIHAYTYVILYLHIDAAQKWRESLGTARQLPNTCLSRYVHILYNAVCVYIYIYIYICMYVYIYIYIYMYIYIYIYKYTFFDKYVWAIISSIVSIYITYVHMLCVAIPYTLTHMTYKHKFKHKRLRITISTEKMLLPRNPSNRETQNPRHLAGQIQIETLVEFEFVLRNLCCWRWWISGV